MKKLALILAFILPVASVRADEDTPVPPEVQKLVETMVAAIKSADDAALLACWHTPEVFAKVKQEEAAKEAGTSPTPIDSAKEGERELKRRTKDNTVTTARAAQMRDIISKRFGELAMLTLTSVEIDEEETATPAQPAYDGIEIRLRTADGTALKIGIDDLIKIDGAWKFKGRLEDDLTIELPDVD